MIMYVRDVCALRMSCASVYVCDDHELEITRLLRAIHNAIVLL